MLDLIQREINQLGIEGLSCYLVGSKLHFDLELWNNDKDGTINDYDHQIEAIKSILLDAMNTIRKGL